MKKICSWCNKDLGDIQTDFFSESAVTHGICLECFGIFWGADKYKLLDFLDILEAPVIVLDSTFSVKSANKQAQALLNKNISDIVGLSNGDAFECAFAKLPGGCGNTIHCKTCTIRSTVIDTFQSGISHLNKPAYLFHGISDNFDEIQFEISTEKVNGFVFLRIDNVLNN